MERVRFIDHKEKKILYVDFSDCTADEVLRVIGEYKKQVLTQPEHSVLLLVYARDAFYDLRVIEALKEVSRVATPYLTRTAVVGLKGLQTIVYDTVTKFYDTSFPSLDDIEKSRKSSRRFDDIGEAEDWLAED